MKYIKATPNDTDLILELVRNTIKSIYPKYYPTEVVDFFCELHSRENIAKDIADGCVSILFENDKAVGTGSFKEIILQECMLHRSFRGVVMVVILCSVCKRRLL